MPLLILVLALNKTSQKACKMCIFWFIAQNLPTKTYHRVTDIYCKLPAQSTLVRQGIAIE